MTVIHRPTEMLDEHLLRAGGEHHEMFILRAPGIVIGARKRRSRSQSCREHGGGRTRRGERAERVCRGRPASGERVRSSRRGSGKLFAREDLPARHGSPVDTEARGEFADAALVFGPCRMAVTRMTMAPRKTVRPRKRTEAAVAIATETQSEPQRLGELDGRAAGLAG